MTDILHGTIGLNALGAKPAPPVPPNPPQTSWWAHRYLYPPAGKAIFGYYDIGKGPSSGPRLPGLATAYEAQFQRINDCTMGYWGTIQTSAASQVLLRTRCPALLAKGTMVKLSLNWGDAMISSPYLFPAATAWQTIANGDMDNDGTRNGTAYLGVKSIMRLILSLGQRVYVSPLGNETDSNNEAGGNGSARFGTAAQHRAAFQHIVTTTRALLAENPAWKEPVWCTWWAYNNNAGGTATTVGPGAWGRNLTDTGSDGQYPGHNFVDWVGFDPYNNAAVSGHPYIWSSPSHMMSRIQAPGALSYNAWLANNFKVGGARTLAEAAPGQGVWKPSWWSETGTVERFANVTYSGIANQDGGGWMDELGTFLQDHPYIKAAMWWGADYWDGQPVTNSRPYTDGGQYELRNDSSCAQRWPALRRLGQLNHLKVRG